MLVAAALHQNVEHVIVVIDSAPQVMTLAIDRQEDFIQMPFVTRARPAVLQLIGVVLPKLETPLPDGFMGDVDPAFTE